MLLRDTVEFPHVALGLVPEILDPVDVVSGVCEELGMVDPVMLERTDIQRIIPVPAVRINDAVGHDLTLNDRQKRAAFGVRDHASINLSTTLK